MLAARASVWMRTPPKSAPKRGSMKLRDIGGQRLAGAELGLDLAGELGRDFVLRQRRRRLGRCRACRGASGKERRARRAAAMAGARIATTRRAIASASRSLAPCACERRNVPRWTRADERMEGRGGSGRAAAPRPARGLRQGRPRSSQLTALSRGLSGQ